MGIFGALSTAVTGLTAQSFALENISGNIANSQTTGYKRVETSFEDMIVDGKPEQQVAGSVVASSRATNTVQGDITASDISTNMALNGTGFFVVQAKTGQVDGKAQFSGGDLYTRRGDFEMNSDGYLVNGAGYYLEGVAIDRATGNPSSSVPGVIQVSNALLPAQATSKIDYQLNLPQSPSVAAAAKTGSSLLNPGDFLPPAGYTPAQLTGSIDLRADTKATVAETSVDLSGSLATAGFASGDQFTLAIGGTSKTFQFYDSAATPPDADPTAGSVIGVDLNGTTNTGSTLVGAINGAFGAGTASLDATTGHLSITAANTTDSIALADTVAGTLAKAGLSVGTTGPTNSTIAAMVAAGDTLTVNSGGAGTTTVTGLAGIGDATALLAQINAALGANGTATLDASGHLQISSPAGDTTNSVTLGGTGAGAILGAATATADPTPIPGSGPVYTISGAQNQSFIDESIEGGSVTAYSANGSPTNVQFRWAMLDSASLGAGHTDSWGLYYLTNSSATGSATMWQRIPNTFTFGSDGALSAGPTNLTISAPVINGVQLGDVALNFGDKGLTEGFTDTTGTASVSTLQQDGYPAGKFTSVSIDDSGRVVASYSNGETIDVAQVVTADFSGADALQRMSGGTFAATKESGTPIISTNPSVSASSLEASNTDISSEFSNLIVTQQAYAAGTKIVSAANDMMQQALNMIR
ncbi:MAG TPA: flagellar hook-basal body complex protein [Devosia sp.]|nr:flagellar hook-basal body complex protein [Devosia sp.]